MARIKEFTVSRGFTVTSGYDSDKTHFGLTVELDEQDDFFKEVGKAIETVNAILLEIPDSGSGGS